MTFNIVRYSLIVAVVIFTAGIIVQQQVSNRINYYWQTFNVNKGKGNASSMPILKNLHVKENVNISSTPILLNLLARKGGKISQTTILQHSRTKQSRNILSTPILQNFHVKEGGNTSLTLTKVNCDLQWSELSDKMELYITGKFNNKEVSKIRKQVVPIFNKPRFKMRQDKFLMPILLYGPNNQMMGFREAVFVAIKLNRTVVIPTFEKHGLDRQKYIASTIDPRHRLSISKICSFVSCITIDQFRETCEKIDAVMHLRQFGTENMQFIENELGMKMAGGPENPTYVPEKYYNRETDILDVRLQVMLDEVYDTFNTPAKCTVYFLPFLNLANCDQTGLCKSFYRELTDTMKPGMRLSPDEDLLLSIVENSPRPSYVNKIANEFISKHMQNMPFFAVHWRFNKQDFMSESRCSQKHMEYCEEALSYTSEKLATRIAEKIHALHNMTGIQIRHIYVASPISELQFVKDTAKFLFEKYKWKTLNTFELETFVKTQYENCDFLTTIFDDVLSTTDMEICSLGFAFFRSIRSTWSENVKISRIYEVEGKVYPQYDEYIFDFRKNISQNKSGSKE